jgi:flagellar motility protein MotE (MotC chaperone)
MGGSAAAAVLFNLTGDKAADILGSMTASKAADIMVGLYKLLNAVDR